jgi:hypothetical protein
MTVNEVINKGLKFSIELDTLYISTTQRQSLKRDTQGHFLKRDTQALH